MTDLVLFCKELGRYPYKYRLYFAEVASIHSGMPSIHRLCVKNARAFAEFTLGRVYTVSTKGVRIVQQVAGDSISLSDDEFFALVDARDLAFLDGRTRKHIRLDAEDYHPADYYYTYSVYRSLIEYTPSFKLRAGAALCKLLIYFLSLLVPVAFYLLFIYATSRSLPGDFSSAARSIAIPLLAMGTLPLMLWLMIGLYTLSEMFLLNLESLRCCLLKSYALRWGGMRKSCVIEHAQRKLLMKSGLVCGGIWVVTLLVSLIL